jgi:catechol 2,3-dioxygenase-like lactoylglutathione lyase family enzyme
MSLGRSEVMAFVATTNSEKSKTFFTDVLGLKLVEDAWFAIVLMAGETRLHIEKVKEFTPQPFTVLGWQVPDIAAMVANLAAKGVKFERYPGLEQDAAGIWATPDGGGKVAWFKDPDGNILSVSEHI